MGGAASKMCGSQNVSGPAPEQSVASSQAAETADTVSTEEIGYLLRLGLNRREVCVDTCLDGSDAAVDALDDDDDDALDAFTARFLGLTKRCAFGRR
jgi:hypothetical protein